MHANAAGPRADLVVIVASLSFLSLPTIAFPAAPLDRLIILPKMHSIKAVRRSSASKPHSS
jgi:hypothetical protein